MYDFGALVRNTLQFDMDDWHGLPLIPRRTGKMMHKKPWKENICKDSVMINIRSLKVMENVLPFYRNLHTERTSEA